MTDRIFLTGLMGAGKSTVGRLLAEKIGYTFIDLDKKIEEKAGKSVSEIFSGNGEAFFRDLETQVLKKRSIIERSVIATGGGLPIRASNRQHMREAGKVVWLDVSPAIAATRTTNSDRPLLQNKNPEEELVALLNERRSFYEDCDLMVDAGNSVEGTVSDIMGILNLDSSSIQK